MVEVRVWLCPSVVVSQPPTDVAPFTAEFVPLPATSCLIVTDWCACRFAVVGFPFVFVVEPSRLMICVTQAVFPAPLDCCVIDALYCAVWVSPDTFMVFS
jgi:hypothetical protein